MNLKRIALASVAAASAGAWIVLPLSGVASADTNTCYPTCTTDPLPTPSEAPANVVTSSASSSTLPFTGADIAEISAVGIGAVALGGTLVALGRRRKSVA